MLDGFNISVMCYLKNKCFSVGLKARQVFFVVNAVYVSSARIYFRSLKAFRCINHSTVLLYENPFQIVHFNQFSCMIYYYYCM